MLVCLPAIVSLIITGIATTKECGTIDLSMGIDQILALIYIGLNFGRNMRVKECNCGINCDIPGDGEKNEMENGNYDWMNVCICEDIDGICCWDRHQYRISREKYGYGPKITD